MDSKDTDLAGLLAQIDGNGPVAEQHFDQIAHHATPDALAQGLAESFRSDQTPPMAEMVASLFGNSSSQQQAGALNQVISTLGPALAASLAGGLLGRLMNSDSKQVSPAQASTVSKAELQTVVEQAQKQATASTLPDDLAAFYAQHSGLIKTLGGAALAVALARMKDNMAKRG
jgi:hypothetical protein